MNSATYSDATAEQTRCGAQLGAGPLEGATVWWHRISDSEFYVAEGIWGKK